MVRNVLILVILGVLGYLGYYAYQSHSEKASVYNGDFKCKGCDSPEEHARFLKENSGDGPDGDSERKTTTAHATEQAEATLPATPRTFGSDATTATDATSTGSSSMVDPTQSAPVVVPTTADPNASIAGVPPVGAPATDTIAPNPPNGMTFTGKGSYQWYRQGNLTWRVDTTSGRSCIIYATMEEWRKQIVMSHGCGRNA